MNVPDLIPTGRRPPQAAREETVPSPDKTRAGGHDKPRASDAEFGHVLEAGSEASTQPAGPPLPTLTASLPAESTEPVLPIAATPEVASEAEHPPRGVRGRGTGKIHPSASNFPRPRPQIGGSREQRSGRGRGRSGGNHDTARPPGRGRPGASARGGCRAHQVRRGIGASIASSRNRPDPARCQVSRSPHQDHGSGVHGQQSECPGTSARGRAGPDRRCRRTAEFRCTRGGHRERQPPADARRPRDNHYHRGAEVRRRAARRRLAPRRRRRPGSRSPSRGGSAGRGLTAPCRRADHPRRRRSLRGQRRDPPRSAGTRSRPDPVRNPPTTACAPS